MNPIGDEVEFGLSRTVTIRAEIVTKPFDTLTEEVTFLWVERQTVFSEDFANASKVTEAGHGFSGPKERVIDDVLGADAIDGAGIAGVEEGDNFGIHDAHHSGVHGGSIARTKGHDGVAVLFKVRTHEGEFLLIVFGDSDLVIASFTIHADEVKAAFGVTKII